MHDYKLPSHITTNVDSEQEEMYQYITFFDPCNETTSPDIELDRRLYEDFIQRYCTESKGLQEES